MSQIDTCQYSPMLHHSRIFQRFLDSQPNKPDLRQQRWGIPENNTLGARSVQKRATFIRLCYDIKLNSSFKQGRNTCRFI